MRLTSFHGDRDSLTYTVVRWQLSIPEAALALLHCLTDHGTPASVGRSSRDQQHETSAPYYRMMRVNFAGSAALPPSRRKKDTAKLTAATFVYIIYSKANAPIQVIFVI